MKSTKMRDVESERRRTLKKSKTSDGSSANRKFKQSANKKVRRSTISSAPRTLRMSSTGRLTTAKKLPAFGPRTKPRFAKKLPIRKK